MNTKLLTSGCAAWLLSQAAMLGVGVGSLAMAEEPLRLFQPLRPPRAVQVVAHRGGKTAAPENTMAAFRLAYEMGVEFIEIDVQRTRDGHHVLSHDSKLDRATNGRGPISEKTLEELKTVDAGIKFAPRFRGTPIPTFVEVLAWAKGKINLYIDAKNINPEQLVKEILDAGMEHQVIIYDSIEGATKIHQVSGGKIPLMPDHDKGDPVEQWFAKIHPVALEVDVTSLNDDVVKLARAAGVFIQTDALGPFDNAEAYRKLIARGVNWLQSDHPENVLAMFYKDAIRDRRHPMIMVHRGTMQLAPENTMAAMCKAVELGLDAVEIDVRVTADRKLIVMHDGKLDRTTNGKGLILKASVEEIKKLDAGRWFAPQYAGERVSTLAEMLEFCRGKLKVKIDAKKADPALLAAEIRACKAADFVWVLEYPPYLEKLAAIAPEIPRMTWFTKDEELNAVLAQAKPAVLEVPWQLCTAERVAEWHKRGVMTIVYAPSAPHLMDEYVKRVKSGVSVIQTDVPLLVMRAVEVALNGK